MASTDDRIAEIRRMARGMKERERQEFQLYSKES